MTSSAITLDPSLLPSAEHGLRRSKVADTHPERAVGTQFELDMSKGQHPFVQRRAFLLLGATAMLSMACQSFADTVPLHTPHTQHEKILIIGAGMAGLGAGRLLHDAGYDVTILEGRNRIGGRVWTSRKWEEIPVDLGASWIHGVRGNPITELADQFDIQRLRSDYENALYFDKNGQAIDASLETETQRLYERMVRAVARQAERGMTLQEAVEATAIWEELADVERHRLLYLFNTIIEHEFAGGINELDAANYDDADAYGGYDVVFPDGYARIAEALAHDLDIRLNQIVEQIHYHSDGVTVQTDQSAFEAARVIVTLPIGVLKAGSVRFVPELPTEKQEAIDVMGAGLLDKLYLRFSTIFWERDTEFLGWIAQETGRWGEWFNVAAYTGAPVLLGFNAASYARKLDGWTDADVVADAMDALRTIYGTAIPDPVDWQRTRWLSDPFAQCSYSFNAVGADRTTRAALAAPVGGRLLFAGEATSLNHPSTVHGAYMSGMRAARHIIEQ